MLWLKYNNILNFLSYSRQRFKDGIIFCNCIYRPVNMVSVYYVDMEWVHWVDRD